LKYFLNLFDVYDHFLAIYLKFDSKEVDKRTKDEDTWASIYETLVESLRLRSNKKEQQRSPKYDQRM
jgi:hypothetical protein